MGKEKGPSEDFKEGHKDGYDHKDWHNRHGWESGAGLGPDKPSKEGNDDYNKGVDQGREDRSRHGK
jgi:hypothetical protein